MHLTNVEAIGVGTIAQADESGETLPHIHVAAGEKARSATGYTSHLLAARVQFLVEMVVIEVESPIMRRYHKPDLFNVPLLNFTEARLDPEHPAS